jgi:hypothetical protein
MYLVHVLYKSMWSGCVAIVRDHFRRTKAKLGLVGSATDLTGRAEGVAAPFPGLTYTGGAQREPSLVCGQS